MNYVEILRTQLTNFAEAAVAMLPQLVVGILVLFATWLIARFAVRIADNLVDKTQLRPSLKQLVETLVRLGVWLLGLLIAAAIVLPGFSAGGMIAGLGIGAVAIGFAFQDIFENFLAGVLIMLREKMRIGDLIEVEGIRGKVEKITLRETYIRQLSNELTIVPNSVVFKNPVQIITDATMRRDELVVGVSYDADLDVAEAAIRKAFERDIEGLHTEKGIGVFAREFGGSSIDWLVQWWSESSSPRDMRDVRTKVVKSIKTELDGAGIEIPFPIVTNMFPERLAVSMQSEKTGSGAIVTN